MVNYLGKTTKLFMGKNSGLTTQYTEVANIRQIGQISANGTSVDVTEYGPSMIREYIAGLADTTDMQMTLASESSSVSKIEEIFANHEEQMFRIQFPSGKKIKFSGSITGYSYDVPIDGVYQFNFTIKPSGMFEKET